ncbi:MAG: anthranilate phosphoribosyltransferase [Abyssibacter sp.]|jgi:anthranilate phosphoribosyltransferase|uniref:anthranilate phosphoribosyltransferase n=1 Tax=Abyssibacter sp. TaxID=2320200 RepID=UPI0032198C4F
MKAVLEQLLDARDLDPEVMTQTMRGIMAGEYSPAQVAGFLIALRCKGETVGEIAAAAAVMRELATPVQLSDKARKHLVDTCGTGGDASGIFNVSTAAAMVVAAAGGHVAKHGNRSVSSKFGSADVLEAAGVKVSLDPEAVARCVDEVGVGFMFAPGYHAAMKHAIGPRRDLGVRTVFNLLGPLTNPAAAPCQVIGVFSGAWCTPIAEVMQRLGSEHVMVVHGQDGLDEISPVQPTHVAELRMGEVRTYTIEPATFGVTAHSLQPLRAASAEESRDMIQQALGGRAGSVADMIALNAGAGIYVAGLTRTLADGVNQAREVLAAGTALDTLKRLARLSQQL